MHKLKVFSISLVVLAAGFYIARALYPTVHPLSGIQLEVNRDDVKAKAESLGPELGSTPEGYWSDAQFSRVTSLIRQTQHETGLARSNELTRNSIPSYYWDIRWRKEKPSFFNVSQPQSGEEIEDAQEGNAQVPGGDVRLRFDTRGNLLGYRRVIADTVQLPSVNLEKARSIAHSFLTQYTVFHEQPDTTNDAPARLPITFSSFVEMLRGHRLDYEFTWITAFPEREDTVKLKVALAGNQVTKFSVDYNVPKDYRDTNNQIYYSLVLTLFYVVCVITMIVLAFRRWRSGELGFRTAFIVGIFTMVIMGIKLYGELPAEMGWTIVFPLVFAPLFVGGGLLFAWAVSESMGRERWKDKFVSIDLLLNGYVLHSRVGISLMQGIGAGMAAFVLWLGLVRVAGAVTTVSLTSETGFLNSLFPGLEVLSSSLYGNLFNISLFVVFLLALLSKRIRSTYGVLLIAALLYGIVHTQRYDPFFIGLVVASVTGFVFVYTFHRFDTLTTLLALVSYSIWHEGLSFLTVGNPAYDTSAYTVFAFFGLVVLTAAASLVTKDPVLDLQELAPAFARYITERQRLQQELAVARKVQMTFLPKREPDFAGLSTASRCAPALEVGGDYYDFIPIDPRKLGIAIGDVSGKGTQAAFYMTLTKGFLRALARSSDSPAKVLTEANKLFYDNVERGAFISMVYGIFDSEHHVLKLARAGHNPVIMRKPQADNVEVIHPTGLALGLEPGDVFARTIQEVSIPYQSGDIFVFYTDGFPEAMNKKQEEFGEQRLCDVIQQYSGHSAQEVMEGVFKEMKDFVGKAKQHDDMTIVVVKIL
ncbi:MAG TPA: PP2C family protein-serine/threonine phosphatase [Bacteroidota bacterium]